LNPLMYVVSVAPLVDEPLADVLRGF